jgi:hypothetical protein
MLICLKRKEHNVPLLLIEATGTSVPTGGEGREPKCTRMHSCTHTKETSASSFGPLSGTQLQATINMQVAIMCKRASRFFDLLYLDITVFYI